MNRGLRDRPLPVDTENHRAAAGLTAHAGGPSGTLSAISRPTVPAHFPALLRLLLPVGLLGYILLQVVLYPPAIGIKDESTYLSVAYVLRSGTIFADVAHISLWAAIVHGGHLVATYPLGESVLLLPAILLNWQGAFVVNLGLQIVGFLLFARLLRHFRIRQEWALLYLFFPALVLFSRTLMTEIPSATFTLLALLLYVKGGRHRIGSGMVFSALVFIRYANVITFALLWLSCILRDAISIRSQLRQHSPLAWQDLRTTQLTAGFLPGFLLLLAYDFAAYGRAFGYGSNGFALHFVVPHLAFYAVDLSLLYPLMLFAPLFYRGPFRLEVTALTFGFLAVISAYYYIDNVHGFAEDLLTGARLLLPVMPVWLLTYAKVLDTGVSRSPRLFTVAVIGCGLVAISLSTVVSLAHQRHLERAVAVRALIYRNSSAQDLLVINDESAKFITPGWGSRAYKFFPLPASSLGASSQNRPVDVIYSAQGQDDAQSLSDAWRTAADVHAALVLDRSVDDWHLMIWRAAG